jgi:hypothetical protein
MENITTDLVICSCDDDNTSRYSFNIHKFVFTIAFTILVLSVSAGYVRDIELTNAWSGWSTVGFTWAIDDAVVRDSRDFYHFAFKKEMLLNSLANWVYPYSYKYLSVEPTIVQLAFILATTLFYSITISLFVKTMAEGSDFLLIALIAIALALCTNAINCNMARFGQANLSLAQAYGVAIPLQILALIMTLRKSLLWAGLVLGLLICVHISLGIMTTVVVAAMVLSCSGLWRRPSSLIGLSIILLCGVVWAISIIGIFDTSTKIMNLKEWTEWERMMSFHFFPFDIGGFTSSHDQTITPFFSLVLVALSSPILSELSASARKMWFVGIIISALLTLCGLIISIYPPSLSLVMIALHRASGITLLLLLPVAAFHLFDLFHRNGFLSSVVGLSCIVPPFLQITWGIPVIPALLVTAYAIYNKDNPLFNWQKKLLILLSLITISYETVICFLDYAKLSEVSILGDHRFFLLICFILIIRVLIIKYKKNNLYVNRVYDKLILVLHSIMPSLIISIIVIVVAWSVYLNWETHPSVPVKLARSYLDAQLWAKSSTPQKAVFMPDPAEPPYGGAWSEYSRRASFGSVRDWLNVPLVYNANLDGFQEGVRRLSLLGIDPYLYKNIAFCTPDIIPMLEYTKMVDDARVAYYSMSPKQLIDLANSEGIDYFIFLKNYVCPPPKLVCAYENDHFVILTPVYFSAQLEDK